jgi:hypothetical protein
MAFPTPRPKLSSTHRKPRLRAAFNRDGRI